MAKLRSQLPRVSNFCAFCVPFMVLASPALGDSLVLQAEIINDLPICQDTDQPFIDVPLSVCQVYAAFADSNDWLNAVGEADIITTDPNGFYHHVFNFTPLSPMCDVIPQFPDMVCDSFVTVGLECDPGRPDDDETGIDIDFDVGEFYFNGHVVGGWLNFDSSNGQGDPEQYPDSRVLLAQFSMAEGENTFGVMHVIQYINGDPSDWVLLHDLPFDCRAGACLSSACPTDVDNDGSVGAFDLATLLGAWGPCDNGVCRCVDADDDGHVGPADLAALLGVWGECP